MGISFIGMVNYMQRSDYLLEAQKVHAQFKKYHEDIACIFQTSNNMSQDIVKYVVQTLHDDNNPEIGRVIIEEGFRLHQSLFTMLKCIVKVLYVIGSIKKYHYGDYHTLQKHIDATLDKIGSTKAELIKKKYYTLLERMKDESPPKSKEKIEDKKEALDSLRDNINRQYIKFI